MRLGTHPNVRAARQARLEYRALVRADLAAATGASNRPASWPPQFQKDPNAMTFLACTDKDLGGMSNDRFEDGASAVMRVLEDWAAQVRVQGQLYQQNPGLPIPDDLLEGVARFELYRAMDQLEMAHGSAREEAASGFIESLRRQVRSDQDRVVAHDRQLGDGVDGVRHSALSAWGGRPAVVNFAKLRDSIEEALATPRREGHALPSLDSWRTPEATGRIQQWDCHPVLDDRARPGPAAYRVAVGQLLAGFLGPAGSSHDAIEQLIRVLSGHGRPADEARAAQLLRARGTNYEGADLDWLSLRQLVGAANRAAVSQHDRLVRTGEDVPRHQAQDFVRIELGDRFEAAGIRRDDSRYRNGVAVELIRGLDALIRSVAADHPIPQNTLLELVERVLKSRPHETALQPSLSPPDTKSATLAFPGATGDAPSASPAPLASMAESALETPKAFAGTRTRTVARGPRERPEHLKTSDAASDLLERAQNIQSTSRAADLAEARRHIQRGKALVAAARQGAAASPMPLWVSGAERFFNVLEKRAEKIASEMQ